MAVLLGDNGTSVGTGLTSIANWVQLPKTTFTATGGTMATAHIEVNANASSMKIIVYTSAGVVVAISDAIDLTAGGSLSGNISGTLTDATEYYIGFINSAGAGTSVHRTDAVANSCQNLSSSYASPGNLTLPGSNVDRAAPRVWIEGTVGGATISASDAVANRGQTDYQFTLSGGDATAGTATLNDGTNTDSITITTYNGDGVNTCTIPSDIAIQHTATATLTFTDAVSGTPTASVDFRPLATEQFKNLVSPVTTGDSFCNGWTGEAPATGGQLVVQLKATGETVPLDITVNADGTWSLSGAPTVNNTTTVYYINAAGEISNTATYTFLVGGGGGYINAGGGFILGLGQLGLRG